MRVLLTVVNPRTSKSSFLLLQLCTVKWVRIFSGVMLGIVSCIFSVGMVAQDKISSSSQTKTTRDKNANSAEEALRERLEAAQRAQRSGEPVRVAQANELLIALGLREMAHLRLVEGIYPQAMELYRKSLQFEDLPDTWVDLAIAEFQAGQLDEALVESGKALGDDANSERAYALRGRVLIQKQEYAKAADDLSKAAELNPDLESLYSLAVCLLQSKNPKEKERAGEVFARTVKIYGDSGSLHVLFGRAYRDAEDMPAAIREFQKAIGLDTRTPHAHYFLGLAHLAVNEWKATPEVRREFSKELEFYPRDYLANYMTGFLASGDRDYAASDRYLKIASEINPAAAEPWLYLGLNAYAQSDMQHAEEYFRKAIKLTGNDEARSNYQIRRAYVDLGRILAKSGRAEESETYLAKARELQNKTMEQSQQDVASMALAGGAGAAAAIIPLSAKQEMEVAPAMPTNVDRFARVDASILARTNLSEKERAAAESQENRLRAVLGLSFNDLATSQAIRKEYFAAVGNYQEAERWDPKILGLQRNLGMSAFRAGNYAEAIRGLSVALEEKPNDAPARAMLGMAYFGSDQFGDAVKVFTPLGERGVQDASVGYAWAASLTRMNELAKATEVLQKFEQGQVPNDVLLLVGQLWIEIGDYSRAVNTFHRALQSDPSLAKAHYFAGKADLRWEHWDDAENELKRELELVPDDPDAKFTLGFVYLKQTKTAQAEELFRQVIAAHPEHSSAQYELGKILLDRGEVKEAIGHLEIAARLSPDTDYVHYQLQAAYRKESRTEDADRELEIYKRIKAKARERATPPS